VHHSKPGSSLECGHISMTATLTAQQKDTHQLCNCDETPMFVNRRQISEQQQACMVMMKILGVALGATTPSLRLSTRDFAQKSSVTHLNKSDKTLRRLKMTSDFQYCYSVLRFGSLSPPLNARPVYTSTKGSAAVKHLPQATKTQR
jgi:hypothetical protein